MDQSDNWKFQLVQAHTLVISPPERKELPASPPHPAPSHQAPLPSGKYPVHF